jgi:hypothetical protein
MDKHAVLQAAGFTHADVLKDKHKPIPSFFTQKLDVKGKQRAVQGAASGTLTRSPETTTASGTEEGRDWNLSRGFSVVPTGEVGRSGGNSGYGETCGRL